MKVVEPEAEVTGVVLSRKFLITDQVIAAAIYLLIGLVGVVLYKKALDAVHHAFLSPTHLLYSHLYLANLGITVCSLAAAPAAYLGGWPFGDVCCTVYATTAMMFGMAAIFFTCFLCVEAYIAIYWEDTYRSLSSRHYHLCAILVWIQAACWAVAPLFGWSSYSLEPVGVSCEINWTRSDPHHVTYVTMLYGPGFALPFGVAAFFLFLSWCSPAPTREEADEGADTEWLCMWFQPSRDHRAAILKASTLHVLTSVIGWAPYAAICALPLLYPGLSLAPLLVLAPSMCIKAVAALQSLILPYCSYDLQSCCLGKAHRE